MATQPIQPVVLDDNSFPDSGTKKKSTIIALETQPDVPASKGILKSTTPPRAELVKPSIQFYDGENPDLFMQKILEMIAAVQKAESAIVNMMAKNSYLQQDCTEKYLTVIKTQGATIIQQMKEMVKLAEEASNQGWISIVMGVVVGVFCALATAVTFGATAGLFALAFAVMMALPPDENPLEKGANGIGDAVGGSGGKILGEITMIIGLTAAALVLGAGIGAFAEEGAEIGSEEAAEQSAKRFTKQTVAAVTRSIAVDTFTQTTVMLNPLGTAAQALSKDKNNAGAIALSILSAIITALICIAAGRFRSDSMGTGIQGLSEQTASQIRWMSRRMAVLFGAGSNVFSILQGVTKDKEADLLKQEGVTDRIYESFRSLLKMMQSSIQESNKEEKATVDGFQLVAQNFVGLADPFKYLADASTVLA